MSSSSTISFKSKKPIQSRTPKSKSKSNPIATQTPDKLPASELPSRRIKNRRAALSVAEIRKIAQGNRKGEAVESNQGEQIFKSVRRQIPTWPEESASPSAPEQSNKSRDENNKIPDRYEMLSKFFDSLDSSIKLLRLKRSTPSFTNISTVIERLTNRRFGYEDLAQMKFILPEAIEIKRVTVLDEKTSCMKPELHVSLNVDAIQSDPISKLPSDHLRKVFRARITDFYKAHPQGDDIPQELLPEPFNRSKLESSSDLTATNTNQMSNEANGCPAVASHLSHSFRRRFSQKVLHSEASGAESTVQNCQNVGSQQSVVSLPEPCVDGIPCSEEPNCSAPSLIDCGNICSTPCEEIGTVKNSCLPVKVVGLQSTPAKLASTPAKLMSATPASYPQKRCYMTPDDGSTGSADKLVRRPVKTRSLKFETLDEDDTNEAEDVSNNNDNDDDILKILPESLLQSIREKERKAQEERDPAISQAKRRRQMISCLPKFFNMMYFLFQSLNRSVITKEELIHKIIVGRASISDRSEVEGQLNLLLELVPQWISKKPASSGDLLICINKLSSPESIRARLEEAK